MAEWSDNEVGDVPQTGNMPEILQSLLSSLNNAQSGANERESSQAENNAGADASYSSSQGEETASSDFNFDFNSFDFSSFFEKIDFDMLMKAGELFARYNAPDRNTELLRALKPHMREENKEKIDTAIKLIKITSLLPFLRESGLFDKLF